MADPAAGPTPVTPSAVPAPAINELGPRGTQLAALVRRARRDVPFYARHLDGVAEFAADGSDADLAALPTFTKADLAGWGPFPLGAVPLAACARVSATSGTTGPRLFVGYTATDWAAVGAKFARIAAHLGFGPGRLLLNVLGSGLWIGGPCFDELARVSGAGLFPSGPTNPEQVLEWCDTFGIDAITATPSFLRLLVERAEAAGIDLHRSPLRYAFAGGEGASPALRDQVRAAFGPGFRWQEMYGSTEVGGALLGYGSPDAGFEDGLDLATDEFVVELLALDDDRPVAPGEIGELTVTSFREACPLIRYRTRDLTRALDGRDRSGLPRVAPITGRIDDALKVRGALVYPGAIEEVLVAGLAPGAEWRIELHRDRAVADVLTITVEADDPAQAEQLAVVVHRRTLVRPEVRVVPPGTLERFGGKARRVSDLRPRD
jgi:phenylacetate-CoA ligase